MRKAIDQLMKADPFVPFIVVMNSGDRYEIRNEHMAVFERDVATVYRLRSNRQDILRMAEITSVEVLDPDDQGNPD